MLSKKNKLEIYIVFFAFTLYWGLLFYFTHSFINSFHFIDDHEIVENFYLLNHTDSLLSQFLVPINSDIQGGRLRPLWILNKTLLSYFIGNKPAIYLAYNCLVAILTTLSLYLFARLINFSKISALFWAFFSLVGEQSAIYFRLGTPETLSTLLLTIILVLTILSVKKSFNFNFYDFCIIGLAIAMILIKENYSFTIIAVIFLKAWKIHEYYHFSWIQVLKKQLIFFLILFLIIAFQFSYIKFYIYSMQGSQYADNFGFSFAGLYQSTKDLFLKSYWIILLINCGFAVTVILFLSTNKKQKFKGMLYALVFSLLIIITQVILYSKSGIYERYLLPGLMGYTFFSFYCLNIVIFETKNKAINFLPIGLSIFIFWNSLIKVSNNFYVYSQERQSLQNLLSLIEQRNHSQDKILVVINPRSFYEFGLSLKKFLNYQLQLNNVYLMSFGSYDADFFTSSLAEAERIYAHLPVNIYKQSGYKSLSEIVDKKGIKTIIIFPPLQSDFLKASKEWFNPFQYNKTLIDLNTKTSFPFYLINDTTLTVYIRP